MPPCRLFRVGGVGAKGFPLNVLARKPRALRSVSLGTPRRLLRETRLRHIPRKLYRIEPMRGALDARYGGSTSENGDALGRLLAIVR